MADKLSVVIGTYHSSVAQFDFDLETGDCERQWVDASSTRAIKTICFNGFFCVYGGNDEMVRIVNVATKKQVGSLFEHQGSITNVECFHNTHLLSSSDDGCINIWSVGGTNKHSKNKQKKKWSWQRLASLRPFSKHNNSNDNENSNEMSSLSTASQSMVHSHKISDFSVHPSGRLLLSIDSRNFMKIWDLVRAKCIVTIAMPKAALSVKWSPDGHTYAILREKKLLIYKKEGDLYKVMKSFVKNNDTEAAAAITEYELQGSIMVSFCYILHDMVAIGDMYGRIIVYDIDSKQPLFRLTGHDYNDLENESENEIEIENDNENENTNTNSNEINENEIDIKNDETDKIEANDSEMEDSDIEIDSKMDENESDNEINNENRNEQSEMAHDESWEYRYNVNSKARIRGLKPISMNGDIYLISADNHGRICIYNINKCLNMIGEYDATMENNSNKSSNDDMQNVKSARIMKKTSDKNEIDDDDDDEDEKTIDDGNDGFEADNESDSENENRNETYLDSENEEEISFDELGLFVFSPLLQVDTEARITCLDAGIVGKLNLLYKWKRPNPNKNGLNENTNENETETEIDANDIKTNNDNETSFDKSHNNSNNIENMEKPNDSDEDLLASKQSKKKEKEKQEKE